MSSPRLQLNAKRRDASSSRVRQQDAIPAVIYGYGLKNISIQVDQKQFQQTVAQAGRTSLINLAISGKKEVNHPVLIRDVQYHPVKGNILHADFYQPRLDKKITAQVPLNFVGESIAVKDLGGVLVRAVDELELEALPINLPHDIRVDISILKDFTATIKIKDLSVSDKVVVLSEPDEVVALVQPPRSEEELEALEEEVTEEVEGVEGVEEKEEGEAEKESEETAERGTEQAEEAKSSPDTAPPEETK